MDVRNQATISGGFQNHNKFTLKHHISSEGVKQIIVHTQCRSLLQSIIHPASYMLDNRFSYLNNKQT